MHEALRVAFEEVSPEALRLTESLSSRRLTFSYGYLDTFEDACF